MKIICDWENCNKEGSYRAPVERDNSKNFKLLWLEHIKIFNKKWNYFSNMNDEEIEYFIKSDIKSVIKSVINLKYVITIVTKSVIKYVKNLVYICYKIV